LREKDETQEIWHGRRAGQEGVLEKFAADDSFPISDIDEILPGLMENKTRVFYTMGLHADFDQRLTGWVNQLKQKVRMGVNAPGEFVALDHALHECACSNPPVKLNDEKGGQCFLSGA